MLQEIITTFEELKKYNYLINIGKKGFINLRFQNEQFFHLLGLHKINLDIYFPLKCISKEKKYKYIKSHVEKFEKILHDKTKDNSLLKQRINTFKYIPDVLNGNETLLYNLQEKTNPMSLYNGDYGLLKVYLIKNANNNKYNTYCLLGLKVKLKENNIYDCVPQSWMASKRPNNLVSFRRPIYVIEYIKSPISIKEKI